MNHIQTMERPKYVSPNEPGWDAKMIHEVAHRFGGLERFYGHHYWPERGSDMMRKVQTRVIQHYGSMERFRLIYFGY